MLDALAKVTQHLLPVLVRDLWEDQPEQRHGHVDDGNAQRQRARTLVSIGTCHSTVQTARVMLQGAGSSGTVRLQLKG